MKRLSIILALAFAAMVAAPAAFAEGEAADTGLVLTHTSIGGDKKASDALIAPNVWLHVPAGETPSPFLAPGQFTSTWTGSIAIDLRAEYAFQAELSGELKLGLNGTVVLEASGKDLVTPPGKSIRLGKGKNTLVARFTSPPAGDAYLRLFWIPKGGVPNPLPSAALSFAPSDELKNSEALRLARENLAEFRCLKCHKASATEATLPELAMDAPSFEGIGSRRNFAWMARWIENPKTFRDNARMPRVLHGPKAAEEAKAAAAFLASLKSESPAPAAAATGQVEAGKKLFVGLNCAGCHIAPDADEKDPKRIALKHVNEKFGPGSLTAFLLKPAAHYEWIRMPNFRLNAAEAADLAAFLAASAAKPESAPEPEAALVEQGRQIVRASGCLNCHASKLENQFAAKPFGELAADKWQQGCMAEKPEADSKAPRYDFGPAERAAFAAFAAGDRASLRRSVPSEFAARETRNLNCAQCHGKMEGFPPLETIGGKLRPEWSRAFIAGEVAYKPRPWVEARMPAFPKFAAGLSQGLVMTHGHPPKTAEEPPIDQDAAKVGQKLISAVGGFSCISCHAAGAFGATQVFESAGINFAYSGERLLKSFYHRWVRNPLMIDPATKMPVYFDEEGKSPLADIFEGDGVKQREAIWQYLRLGDKMPAPAN